MSVRLPAPSVAPHRQPPRRARQPRPRAHRQRPPQLRQRLLQLLQPRPRVPGRPLRRGRLPTRRFPSSTTGATCPTDRTARWRAMTGPRHALGSGLLLGSAVDAEADGAPNSAATGDGADEDGVVRLAAPNSPSGGWLDGRAADGNGCRYQVTVNGGSGVLQLWMDFGSGLVPVTVLDAAGALVPGGVLEPGVHMVACDVPARHFQRHEQSLHRGALPPERRGRTACHRPGARRRGRRLHLQLRADRGDDPRLPSDLQR